MQAVKDDEEEIKLPTPTLIANQNKSSSIAEVVDVVDVEAQAPRILLLVSPTKPVACSGGAKS